MRMKLIALILVLLVFFATSFAQKEDSLLNKPLDLKEVTIIANSTATFNAFSKIDLNLRPAKSAQEILRIVPGLFIAQHQGGGKAEQIFLRGFDIDHGTDVNISVDGLPVNMVSHAHGQGYADLHFIIPETIVRFDYGKGPYNIEAGNFGTAGDVRLNTLNQIDKSILKVEGGQFNTWRGMGMVDLLSKKLKDRGTNAYLATEFLYSDGPFENPQNFNRFNAFGKLNTHAGKSIITLLGSFLTSQWDASGQIPERAVKSGMITRFGAIDKSEGGYTSRANGSLKITSVLTDNSVFENQAYYTKYFFNLHSNFTFFLNDPVNGDQIRQRESRNIFGTQSSLKLTNTLPRGILISKFAAGFRHDQTNNSELAHTINQNTILDFVQLGDVNETNLFGFAEESYEAGNWLLNFGTRLDHFIFRYKDELNNGSQKVKNKTALSPKLNLQYTFNQSLQIYAKFGKGFHSNDARAILFDQSKSIVPAAYGSDLGIVFKPASNLLLNVAAWYLFLEDELVFVGDEGIVEESGKTRRIGIDASARYQFNNWLFADLNINLARPRSIDAPKEENLIPLAPTLTSTGGLSWKMKNGFNGSLMYRYMKTRPANENNTIKAHGYTIADISLNYTRKKYEFGASVENLFDVKWNEAQFATNSRLKNESSPVEEIHFTAGVPFFCRLKFAIFF